MSSALRRYFAQKEAHFKIRKKRKKSNQIIPSNNRLVVQPLGIMVIYEPPDQVNSNLFFKITIEDLIKRYEDLQNETINASSLMDNINLQIDKPDWDGITTGDILDYIIAKDYNQVYFDIRDNPALSYKLTYNSTLNCFDIQAMSYNRWQLELLKN